MRTVAELGYEYIELSPRDDLLKNSLRTHGVQPSSVLPLYKWSSPDETERQAAVRYWRPSGARWRNCRRVRARRHRF